MSATELVVIGFGLFAGYWVVSQLIADKPRPQAGAPAAPPPPGESGRPWHEVLEVAPGATIAEIRAAYHRLIGQYHPDKVATLGSELRELAERKAKEINAAHAEGMRARGMVD